jgi:hypothetical protein
VKVWRVVEVVHGDAAVGADDDDAAGVGGEDHVREADELAGSRAWTRSGSSGSSPRPRAPSEHSTT